MITNTIFINAAVKRLEKNFPSTVEVVKKNINLDQIVECYKTETNEAYIVTKDNLGIYSNPYHVWFLHKTGFILRGGNGSLGYKTVIKALADIRKTIKSKNQQIKQVMIWHPISI